MKNYLRALAFGVSLCVLLPSIAQAQLLGGGGTVVVTPSIVAGTTPTDCTALNMFYADATSKFGCMAGTSWDNTNRSLTITGTGSGTDPTLSVVNGAATQFTVLDNGNMGIGIATPAATLDINGVIRTTGFAVPASGVGIEIFYYPGGPYGQIYAYDRDTALYKDLFLGSNGNQMVLKASGNVGIGITDPQAILHINGDVRLDEMTAPAAPAANGARLYCDDNGAGKTRCSILFATGAAQQIAIEP